MKNIKSAGIIILIRDSAILIASLLSFGSCSKSVAGAARDASDATSIANRAAYAAYDKIASLRCHKMVGVVSGSGVLKDGELTAADESFRELLDWKRQPIIVVAFGDNKTADGDAAADRQLAIHRAAFVTQRLKSFEVPVGQALAIGGPTPQGSATSAEMYFSCPPYRE